MGCKVVAPGWGCGRLASAGSVLTVGLARRLWTRGGVVCAVMVSLLAPGSGVVAGEIGPKVAGSRPERLRCEFLVDPEGIDAVQPRLGWVVEAVGPQAEIRGVELAAYEVLVSSSLERLKRDEGDLWKSGKVPGDGEFRAVYGGRPLNSWEPCFWKVRVWDKSGRRSEWSEPARWTMGLLSSDDWKGAKWIGMKAGTPVPTAGKVTEEFRPLAARQLRSEFDARQGVRSATVALCGLGLSELYLNGKKVGDDVLSPPLTDYDKRVMYVVHDVTSLVRHGRNAVGVWLGNGRYWTPRSPEPTRTFGAPTARLILRIQYDDGTVQEVVSDEAWKVTDEGPIRANDEYDGEEYDARKELAGWTEPGYDDVAWKSAEVLAAPAGKLLGCPIAPIRVIEKRRPIAKTQPKAGVYVLDMGQNLVGWCRLRVEGPAGTTVRLRHAETLQSDGTLDMRNLGIARCTDTYTLKGGGREVYEPRFTYHGFRYLEVTGYPGELTDDAVEACVVHDDLEPAGDFACSNELLNRIHAACRWGIRGNYRSIPTDCPQRDERQGWLGDRSTNCCGEAQLFNVAAFYEKWLADIADSQRPDGSISDVCPAYWPFYHANATWAGAIVLVANDVWQQYDDRRLIERHYPAMRAWVEFMCGLIVDDRMPRDTYGDWCFPPEDPTVAHSKDPTRTTRGEVIGTAYFAHILRLMSRFAEVVGRPDDAARYGAMAERMKGAFHERFFHAESGAYDNGTQTSSLLPLSFGLTPPDERGRAFERLVKNIEGPWKSHVGTGVVGVQHLMRVLSDNGRPDLALRIATQADCPSWGHMIQKGATTIWELWNGDTAGPSENSRNHVMLIGDLLPWMYEYLAGIRTDPSAQGYRRVVLKPVFVDGLDYVRAWRETNAGRIASEWKRAGGDVLWDVSVPVGATATVWVAAEGAGHVSEGDRPAAEAPGVKLVRDEKGTVVFEIGPGTYRFRVGKGKVGSGR